MAKAYQKADRLFQDGKLEQALEMAAKVPADDEDWIDAQALSVECLSELGRFAEADIRAADVLARDPHWATGYWVRGLAALEDGKLDAAERFLGWAWENDDTFAEAALILSALADYHGRYEHGDDWLQHARKADKSIPQPVRLSASELDDVLLEVMDEFPEEALETLEESHFRVVPMPGREEMSSGVGLTDTASLDFTDPEGDPPNFGLTFYQRNLERGAKNLAEIRKRMAQEIEAALGNLAAAQEG